MQKKEIEAYLTAVITTCNDVLDFIVDLPTEDNTDKTLLLEENRRLNKRIQDMEGVIHGNKLTINKQHKFIKELKRRGQ